MKAKVKELREKSQDGLKVELSDTIKHLFTLRSQAVTEKLEDPSQIKKARRKIALLNTLIRENELKTAAK